jgi:D-tyrosyl-tRNA(Tyr) deacylase
MRAVLQRVARAEVRVDGETVGRVGRGLVVLLGVGREDDPDAAERLARKTARLRIFADEEGRMNRSLLDVQGEALVVSQFTLFADARKGNRPGFTDAAPPERGDELYRAYAGALADQGARVATGIFQAHMEVELVNDGPVTIWLDSAELGAGR